MTNHITQKIIILDCDNTLVRAFTTEPLPGIIETLEKLKGAEKLLAIATNQAGPIWRRATGNQKFPTAEKLGQAIAKIATDLELCSIPWFISIADPRAELTYFEIQEPAEYAQDLYQIELVLRTSLQCIESLFISQEEQYRMPGPGMLLAAVGHYQASKQEALFVGEMESDKKAAEAAGIAFMRTKELIDRVK